MDKLRVNCWLRPKALKIIHPRKWKLAEQIDLSAIPFQMAQLSKLVLQCFAPASHLFGCTIHVMGRTHLVSRAIQK
jgi:hypothetical protein